MKTPCLKHFYVRRIICLAAAVILVSFLSQTAPAPGAGEPGNIVKVALIVPSDEAVPSTVMELIRKNLPAHRESSGIKPPLLISLKVVDAPASRADARRFFEKLCTSGTLAVLNLCEDRTACYAKEGAAETGIPTILFHSETVPPGPDEKAPSPFLFGLDADEGYRPEALAFWARKGPEKNWVVFVDHLDTKSRSLGLATVRSLTASGLAAWPVLLSRTSENRLKQAISESLKGGTKAFISFLSPSRTLQAARLIETSGKGGTLIYGRRPTEMLLRHDGLIAFRQRMPFAEEVPAGHAAGPVDSEIATKAVVASRWLAKALFSLDDPQCGRQEISKALTEVGEVRLGSGSIRLSEELHRPVEKDIAVLESRQGTWSERKRLKLLVAEDGQRVIRQKGTGTSPESR
ncbi:MAG: hypothetical protein ACLFN0_08005 [Thermovirgaceae bacterium]